MWRWRYLYRRIKCEPNAAAHGGRAFDEALNLRYKRHGSSPCTSETEAEMLALIDQAYEGVELPLDEHRTPIRYKEAIVGYNQRWQGEAFKVLGVQVPFAVELGRVPVTGEFWGAHYANIARTQAVTFTTPLPTHVRVVLRGILDLFVQLPGDYIVIYDTKTSKDDITGKYDNSAQLKAYMYALQELARLYPDKGFPLKVHAAAVNGVIIRPHYKYEGRTPKSNDKPRLEFMRTMPAFYTSERLERWRLDTLAWVKQALEWVATDHFPQNERHCTFYMDAAFKNYGTYGKECPYLCVCSSPENQQEVALSSDMFMEYGEGPLGGVQGVEVAPTDKC